MHVELDRRQLSIRLAYFSQERLPTRIVTQIPEYVVTRDATKSRFVVLLCLFQPFKGMVIVTSPGEHGRDTERCYIYVFFDQFGQKLFGLVLLPQVMISHREARETIPLQRLLLNRL